MKKYIQFPKNEIDNLSMIPYLYPSMKTLITISIDF
jgi:hypothetical protein